MRHFVVRRILLQMAMIGLLAGSAHVALASKVTTVYAFRGGAAGSNPSVLIAGPNGSFFGIAEMAAISAAAIVARYAASSLRWHPGAADIMRPCWRRFPDAVRPMRMDSSTIRRQTRSSGRPIRAVHTAGAWSIGWPWEIVRRLCKRSIILAMRPTADARLA